MPGIRLPVLSCFALFALGSTGCESTSTAPDSEKVPVEVGGGESAVGLKTGSVSFVRDIKPVLEDRCVMCHNRKVLPNRPSFENRELALKGDAAGPIIVPGDAEGSRLVVAISSPDHLERAMPPVSHRVSKAEVALIRTWIDEGVAWPEGPEGQLKSDKVPAE